MADQDTNIEGTGTGDLADASKATPQSATPAIPSTNIAEEVGLPVREVPLTSVQPMGSGSNTDLVRILEEVKLPERKDFRASGDEKTISVSETSTPEEAPPEAPPAPKPRDAVSAVHTLRDDFQSAVQDQKISLVQAAALEQQKRAHKKFDENTSERDTSRRVRAEGTIITILALIVLGIIAFSAVFFIIRDRTALPQDTFLVEGLLFSEQSVPLPIQSLSSPELKRQLSSVRVASGLTLGAITRVTPTIESVEAGKPTSRDATTREFFKTLEANMPEELLRALGDQFFLGFHTVDENAPLIIIPVTSYERAFAGALAWERTMNADLTPIFTQVPALIQQNDGLLVERKFADTVMRNYDMRILKDDTGTVQLYYSFPSRDILIIAESPYSFAEILSRLRADRRL